MEEIKKENQTANVGSPNTNQIINKLQASDRKIVVLIFAAAIIFISLILYLVFGLKLFDNKPTPQEVVKEIPKEDKVGYSAPVEDDSMSPVIEKGDDANIELYFNDRSLKRGEIVLLRAEENSLIIKRIVGLPGEKIKISNGKVFIDGQVLEEPYLPSKSTLAGEFLPEGIEKEIPEDHYAYLADNREDLKDSRTLGFISSLDITGIVK